MAQKIGRNDPCPCGSGNKFKKCCAAKETFKPIIPDSLLTGTPYDDYLKVFSLLGLYGQGIMRFEKDGRELKKITSAFERRFHPGKPGGLTDSLFMSWVHCDLRFGSSRETIAERFLRDRRSSPLAEPGPVLIGRMASSYSTFYEIIENKNDASILEELGTGKRWTVRYIRELYEMEPVPGEIWFTRLLGAADDVLCYITPYIYGPETKAQFQRATRLQEKHFFSGPRGPLFPQDRHFAESQKEATVFWAEFIHRGLDESPAGLNGPPEHMDIDDIPAGARPFLVNTDGDDVVFAEITFRLKDEPAVRKRLAALKTFSYDEKRDSWTWLKKPGRDDIEESRTIRGTFRLQDGFLIAETNSRERAAWFKDKLKGFLGDLIAYDGTRWRDQDDFPELTPDEEKELRRDSDELNSRPEVKEALGRYLENHYFRKWPHAKIPALGGLTPLQASKTERGREKLKALLDDIEARQDTAPPGKIRIDFDRLRRMLGLPPRVH